MAQLKRATRDSLSRSPPCATPPAVDLYKCTTVPGMDAPRQLPSPLQERFKKETGTFFSDHNEYVQAVALFLSWEEQDLDAGNRYAPEYTIATETQSLLELFRDELNFTCHSFAIPTLDPVFALYKFLLEALGPVASEEKALIVIYYAGHHDTGSSGGAHIAALVRKSRHLA